MIHLNNAGAAIVHPEALKAQTDHLTLEAELGGYEAAAVRRPEMTRVYETLAELVSAKAEEIAFVDSASRGWNVLVYSLELQPGDEIVTIDTEFGTNIVTLAHICQRSGATLRILPTDDDGLIPVHRILDAVGPRTKVVALSHAAAHGPLVNPVSEVGKALSGSDIFYIVDACQSLGQMSVSVSDINCSALVATGRKWLRAPRGTGFIYVHPEWSKRLDPILSDLASGDYVLGSAPDSPRVVLREDAKRFEIWERSIAGMLGLGAAVRGLLDYGEDAVYAKVRALAQQMEDGIRSIPGLIPVGPAQVSSGVVTAFTRGDTTPDDLKQLLTDANINASTMADYDAPCHFPRLGATKVLRLAAHHYNEPSDVDAALDVLRRASL